MADALFYIAIFLLTPKLLRASNDTFQNDRNFYVSSYRKGCVNVTSMQPCPATILSPDKQTDYEPDIKDVSDILDKAKQKNASDECISALTKTLCSSLTPRCFVNGSKDYGDVTSECWTANSTCPYNVFNEATCYSLQTGMKPLSNCVKPTKTINGSCPQPKYKMPEEDLNLYITSSLGYEESLYFENLTTASYRNGTKILSTECVSKIIELYCLPFYCSADEKKVVVEYTYEQCVQVFDDCFEAATSQLSGNELAEINDLIDIYIPNCDFYPENEDLTSSGSGASTSVPPSQNISTTPPRQNISTTPPRQNISTTSPRQNISTTPVSQNISTAPPSQNISSTTPPGQNVSSTTSKVDFTSTPPGENITTTTLERTTSSTPHKETELPRTTSPTNEILQTPLPTCGSARCQNFPLLFLSLFLFVFVKLV